jgi:hypothetical protein
MPFCVCVQPRLSVACAWCVYTSTTLAGAADADMDEKVAVAGMTEEIMTHMTNTAKSLLASRKQRSKVVPPELATAGHISGYKMQTNNALHSSSMPGSCVYIYICMRLCI